MVGAGRQRLYSGAVNVKWFGARGDGAAPDDAAIPGGAQPVQRAKPGGHPRGVNPTGSGAIYIPQTCLWLHTDQGTVVGGQVGSPSNGIVLRDCQFIQVATSAAATYARQLRVPDRRPRQARQHPAQRTGLRDPLFHCTFPGNEIRPAVAPFACINVLGGLNTEDMHFEAFAMEGPRYGFHYPTSGNSFSFRSGGWGNIVTGCVFIGAQAEVVIDGCGSARADLHDHLRHRRRSASARRQERRWRAKRDAPARPARHRAGAPLERRHAGQSSSRGSHGADVRRTTTVVWPQASR